MPILLSAGASANTDGKLKTNLIENIEIWTPNIKYLFRDVTFSHILLILMVTAFALNYISKQIEEHFLKTLLLVKS